MARLEMIKGIDKGCADLLRETCAINSVTALLKAGATPEGREFLAAALNVPCEGIIQWLHQADMFRVKGVGKEYLALLNEVGVKTLDQLRQQAAETLCERMRQVNGNHRLVRRLPTLEMVNDWIEQANELTPILPE